MNLLKRYKLHVPYKFIYMAAFLFSAIVLLKSGSTNANGEFEIQMQHIILFSLNYLLWAIIIEWVYGVTKLLDKFLVMKSLKPFLELLINLFLILTIHLLISNFLYFLYLVIASDFTLDNFYSTFLPIILRAFLSRLLDIVIIVSILKIIDTYKALQKRKIQLIELENQLHISQLESLKAQLQPHFLFNSLHALHTLIGHDDTKAKSMVIKISSLLRKLLDQRDQQVGTLNEELNYLKDYLEIEQERFHDRLSIHYNIEDETKDLIVPVLLLQPLAENAFKHGISIIESGGFISLSTKIEGDDLIIEMSNTIPTDNHTSNIQSTKLGLSNLKNRLNQLYNENYSLMTKKHNSIFIVTIKIKKTFKA